MGNLIIIRHLNEYNNILTHRCRCLNMDHEAPTTDPSWSVILDYIYPPPNPPPKSICLPITSPTHPFTHPRSHWLTISCTHTPNHLFISTSIGSSPCNTLRQLPTPIPSIFSKHTSSTRTIRENFPAALSPSSWWKWLKNRMMVLVAPTNTELGIPYISNTWPAKICCMYKSTGVWVDVAAKRSANIKVVVADGPSAMTQSGSPSPK